MLLSEVPLRARHALDLPPRAGVLVVALLAACSHGKAPAPAIKGAACSEKSPCAAGLVCTDAPVGLPATPGHAACAAPGRHYTFRAIAGVSMGAAGSSRLVAEHPERFDAAGFLGGPLDAALLTHSIQTALLGGFCSADKLEAALALDRADGGNRLDRPDGIPGCTQANPTPATHFSRSQRFNHWAFTINGGHFDRGTHLDIFRDLTTAIGNPLSSNPNSPALAAPLTPAQYEAATCAAPFVVPHVIDATYSPHGEHQAITFCDGDAPVLICADGTSVDWCQAAALAGHKLAVAADADGFCASHGGGPQGTSESAANPAAVEAFFNHQGELPGCWAGTQKVPLVLAIDLNGNGRRDYHEPLLVQAQEPFDDVGADGCPNEREDGKGGCTDAAHSPFAQGVADPNGDDYDPRKNPGGTERDFRWEPGEPFQDVGLDGVPNTHDEGEGDGKFTTTPGLQRWYQNDLRTALRALPPEKRAALDLYFEGGIRDVFDLGAMAEAAAGGADGLRVFDDFLAIPPQVGKWGTTFDPLHMNLEALGKNLLVAYGTPGASRDAIRAGDGDHVGTVDEVLNRFFVFFRWLSKRWDPVVPPGGAVPGDGSIVNLHYPSPLLGAEVDYAVSLPPQYDAPANAQKRYPVLFLLHGYGQSAEDMAGTGSLVNILTGLGKMREIIVVFPSGRCCLTGPHGERTCRDQDDAGVDYTQRGYVRECARGSFYLDRQGLGAGDYRTPYGLALLELMGEVDRRYRTLPPMDGPAF